MKRVVFYSYRGGTGRTTLLVNAAVALARMGERVCLLDCDFGAPGLARWRDLRASYADFSPTFTETISDILNGGHDWRIRPRRVPAVMGMDDERLVLRTIEPGSLWFLPPGRLDPDFLERIRDRGWPDGESDLPDIRRALSDIVKRVERELAPTILIVDTSPGVDGGIGTVIDALEDVDLLVFTTRLTPQAFEGFDVAKALGTLLDSGNLSATLLPVATFIPPGAELTTDFQRKTKIVSEALKGCRVEHTIPLIPELGLNERVLTTAWPEDSAASFAYWRIAETIAEKLLLASGLETQGRRLERELAFELAQQSYSSSYASNTANAIALLGSARCALSMEHRRAQTRIDEACRLLRAFLIARGVRGAEHLYHMLHDPLPRACRAFATAIATELRTDEEAIARMHRSPRYSAIIGRVERESGVGAPIDIEQTDDCAPAARAVHGALGLRTSVELADLLYLVAHKLTASGVPSEHVPRSNPRPPTFAYSNGDVYFFPSFGQYDERTLSDLLQDFEVVVILPQADPRSGVHQPTMEALRRAATFDESNGAATFHFRTVVGTVAEIIPPEFAWGDEVAIGSAARTLFIVSAPNITDDALLEILCRASVLFASRPRCRVIVAPETIPSIDAERRDRVGVFAIAPPARVDEWLRRTLPDSYSAANAYDIEATSRTERVTVLVEDQGPGRALRDLLEESPSDFERAARAEVWLTKLPALLDIIDAYELAADAHNDPALSLPGLPFGATTSKDLDVLCIYQPRLSSLLDSARRLGRPIQSMRVLSLLTGYLIYRKDHFENEIYRERYYHEWQRGERRRERLTVPRTFCDVLEKAAFFDYVLEHDRHGLMLQHGLRPACPPTSQPEEALVSLWQEWSMLSRLLVGHTIVHENLADGDLLTRLDSTDGDLFSTAMKRLAQLSAFASPRSWSATWDVARQSLVDGNVAMTITWSDSAPLVADALTSGGRGAEVAYTLINLDDRTPANAHIPLAHIDGLVAVLLEPQKRAAAADVLGLLDSTKAQTEFIKRGGSPPERVAIALAGGEASSRFVLDARATRYGVPRAHNPDLDRPFIVAQAKLIAETLNRASKQRITGIASISQFRSAYDRISLATRES